MNVVCSCMQGQAAGLETPPQPAQHFTRRVRTSSPPKSCWPLCPNIRCMHACVKAEVIMEC